MKNNREYKGSSISYYKGGVQLQGLRGAGGKGPGGKRGAIKGWSMSSRRRMREFLLCHEIPEDYWQLGVTLTIPGPALTDDESKDLFDYWSNRANKQGWALVWRMEVQKRGAKHWHLLLALPRDQAADSEGAERIVTDSWLRALDRFPIDIPESAPLPNPWLGIKPDAVEKAMSQIDYVKELKVKFPDITEEHVREILLRGIPVIWGKCPRSHWCGAMKYSCDVQVHDERCGSWKRYLQDHATKAKQEQIPEGMGRHWGVVGRKRFDLVVPEEVQQLSPECFAKFLRAYQRLCTPQLKDRRAANKRSPFGRRLGRRIRRGSWGKSVWYSDPATVKRLATWAAENPI